MSEEDASELVDDGDRSKSKFGIDKETDEAEVEVVDRQKAPKVSVKVERQQNLGHYNNANAQVFMSSGTIESMRGDITDEDGNVKPEVEKALANVAKDLEKLARNRVVDALKKHTEMGIDVDADIHDVDSRGGK